MSKKEVMYTLWTSTVSSWGSFPSGIESVTLSQESRDEVKRQLDLLKKDEYSRRIKEEVSQKTLAFFVE